MSYKLWIDIHYKKLTKNDLRVIANALTIPLPPVNLNKKSLHSILVNEIKEMKQIDQATQLHFGIQDMKSCVSSKFTIKNLKILWVDILKQDESKLHSKKKKGICKMILDLLVKPVKVMVHEEKEREEKKANNPTKTYINNCMKNTVKQIKASSAYRDIPKTHGKSKLKKKDLCKLLAKLNKKLNNNPFISKNLEKKKKDKKFDLKNNHKKWCFNDSDFISLEEWDDIKSSDIIIVFDKGKTKGICYDRKSLLQYMKTTNFYYWEKKNGITGKTRTFRLVDKLFTYFHQGVYKLLQNKKYNAFVIADLDPKLVKPSLPYVIINDKHLMISKQSKIRTLRPIKLKILG